MATDDVDCSLAKMAKHEMNEYWTPDPRNGFAKSLDWCH